MAYALDAIIGPAEVLGPLAQAYRSARVRPLHGAMAIVPLNEVLRNAIQRQMPDPEHRSAWPFASLSPEGATNLAETCEHGALVYVEAQFYAGVGTQASVGWRDGALRHGPVAGPQAINDALRFLGVLAEAGKDEFDTLGLGRFRSTEQWDGRGPVE